MEASPVLKAMLDSSMQEGESRKIRLEDSCTRAVSLFLETLYLGTSGRGPIRWKFVVVWFRKSPVEKGQCFG